jgi:hypothetical protein
LIGRYRQLLLDIVRLRVERGDVNIGSSVERMVKELLAGYLSDSDPASIWLGSPNALDVDVDGRRF